MSAVAITAPMERQLFVKRYYKANRFLMGQLGIWPDQSRAKRIVLPIINGLIATSIFIPVIIRMHDIWGQEIDHFIEALPPMMIITMGAVKLLNGVVNQPALLYLLDQIVNDWKLMEKSSSSIAILQKHAKEGRKLTIVYTTLLYSAMTAFNCLPLIPIVLNIVAPLNESRPKTFVIETEYRIDFQKYYYFLMVHYMISCYVVISIYVTVDTMYAVWVQHCCALFEIVGYNLQNAIDMGIDLETHTPQSGEAVQYGNLCYCIKQHKHALIFANLIESTFSGSLAYITGVSMVMMSITGVLLVIKIDDFAEAARFGALCASQVVHLYFHTLPGQKLINYSTSISQYTYACNWYRFSTRTQMLLKLIIARSHKPCILTAGKVYLINMENFSAVMKTSMSYFTVFCSLR